MAGDPGIPQNAVVAHHDLFFSIMRRPGLSGDASYGEEVEQRRGSTKSRTDHEGTEYTEYRMELEVQSTTKYSGQKYSE